MNTRKLATVLGAVCVLAAASHAATGWVEDFNDGVLTGWGATNNYALTEAGGILTIDATKNASWNSFTYNISPNDVNLLANRYFTIKVKADTDLNLNISLWDTNTPTNNYAYPVLLETSGYEITASDDFETYCFNFANVTNIDFSHIHLLNFVFNPGSPAYNGNVYFDDLRIGSETQPTPSITDIPTQQHIINAPLQRIPFRGVLANGGGTPITITAVSSNTGLIPNPTVYYASPNTEGYVSYTPVANQWGTATVTLTVSAPATSPKTMAFDVVVERNMAPHTETIADQDAEAGTMSTIALTDIDDGNPNARQAIAITAESSNPSLIPDPTVVYTSDGFEGQLQLTPTLGQTGTATITVTLQDDGGTIAGGSDTDQIAFDVTVYEHLNLSPTIDDLVDISILENSGEHSITLTGISDGDTGVEQNLTIVAVSSDTNIIPTPAVDYTPGDSTGTLRFTPATNKIGNSTITVTVTDDGGLPNNNGDESTQFSFNVQVRVPPVYGFEDDFNDGIFDANWLYRTENAHWPSEANGTLIIDVNKIPSGNIWAGLWFPFPTELDINAHPYISIRMKTTRPNDMLIFLWDYQNHYNTGGTVSKVVTSSYVEYFFDFTGKNKQGDGQEVNFSRLTFLLFNFDPGGTPLYWGTFYFDDLRVGDKAHLPVTTPVVTIDPVPDYAVAKNSPQQVINLTGISDGNNNAHTVTLAVQSSNTGVIPTPVASAVVDGNATLTYTPAAGATGTSVITVTGSCPGSTNKQVAFDIAAVATDTGVVAVNVNLSTHYQEIDGFGATFSLGESDVVLPCVKDIGMSMARIGIIDREFEANNENSDGNILDLGAYNPNAMPMKFMKHMKERTDVEKFIVTAWSPPAWMKKNKCWPAEGWATDNILQPRFYNEYGEMWVALIKQVKKETGIDVYAISLQNEPQFNEPYTSCVISWEPYRDLVRIAGPHIKAECPNVKLFWPEALMAQNAIDEYIHTLNADPVARNYMDIVATHGSFGATAWQNIYTWSQEAPAKKNWMTETSGHADTWSGAMTLAQEIYDSLYYGNISAWTFWTFNVGSGGEPYGLIVNAKPTSRYYTSKQYYKWIRPGAYRVAATSGNSDILTVAFEHQGNDTATVVLINKGTVARAVNVSGAGLPSVFESYMTSEFRNCIQGQNVANGVLLMPPSSVVTLYGGAMHNNMYDFAGFAEQWRRTDCDAGNDWCDGADSNQDESVLLDDLADFAAEWLDHV